jgi:acetyltransferase-like isoleucine patch superfamily enzyme
MINKIVLFLYFQIGCKLRYFFWKVFIKSSGGCLGRHLTIYEQVRINSGNPKSIFIGDNVRFLRGVTISTYKSGKIFIGNNVHIGEYSIAASNKEITIKDDVIIGPHTVIVDLDHVYVKVEVPINKQGFRCEKIMIEEDVWIASHCTIVKGVTIGKGSVVGAGSVVNKDIPPYSMACGVPAKVIKKREKSV